MTQKKPPELKRLAGTARADRDTAGVSSLLPRLDVVPPPPDWMTLPAAVREWNTIAPLLAGAGVLRASMVSPLAHLCQLHAEMLRGYEIGLPPKAATVMAYTRLAGLFGLTAVDAARLPAPDRKRENKFAQFKS